MELENAHRRTIQSCTRDLINWSRLGIVVAVASIAIDWLSLKFLGSFLAGLGFNMLAFIAKALIVLSVVVVLWKIVQMLRALHRRAQAYQPKLERSAKDVRAMHYWPLRNIPGPVTILAETGVSAALGPGRFIWYVTCTLWPIALVSLIRYTIGVERLFQAAQQSSVLLILAFGATAFTARALAQILAPEDTSRAVPVGSTARDTEPAFWSKGLIAVEHSTPPAKIIDPPIDDVVDDYYRL